MSSPDNSRGPGEITLPVIHDAANEASGRGQTAYVRLSASRLVALLIATLAAALGIAVGNFDFSGLIVLFAFVLAALAELALIRFQPERDWYAGRAVAESTKTLAWRFAVQGEPFGPTLTEQEAEALLRTRVSEVLLRGKDQINVGPGDAVLTDSMLDLRRSPFSERRDAYLEQRTEEQRAWYWSNARKNEVRATAWRYALLLGELLAIVAAALSLGRDEPFDFAGIVAAFVAGGAAWLAIKQHSQLTSAYRVAAGELAIQADVLRGVSAEDWPQAVADAEEAISREHTMWLATRGEEPLPPPRIGRA
ncbi:DUF4231 domain-containing protein [Promicromonospora thailandica]|uniref:DUF4231 domain-containing protein n=1 Tax=Promicromonospora thailandica TaxID=765201 RepID=A0A9X2G6X1_9MICO|nr:DUF4231 domain-containing protein [Promicromonospora thailandica]MCP2266858.1 Protein of unknown function (DUF4231) [Promicromonospora thailandica]